MTWLALPWFVLRNTNSPQRMTWVIIAEVLPVAVLGFWGGAIAGRRWHAADDARVRPRARAALRRDPGVARSGRLPFSAAARPRRRLRRLPRPYFSVQRAVVPELVGEEQAEVAQAAALFQAANRTHDLPRPAARRRPDQPDRNRERVVRRRGDLPRVVPDRRRVRAAAGGRGRGRRPACSTACGSSRATSCCGSGRRRSP